MAIKTSKGKENYYARYKSMGVQAKNRKIKLERALRKDPENEQIKLALKDIRYRRGTPSNPIWSASAIRMAKIFKEFCGHFSADILSSNPKTAAEAIRALPSRTANWTLSKRETSASRKMHESMQNKAMFSIAARANIKALN